MSCFAFFVAVLLSTPLASAYPVTYFTTTGAPVVSGGSSSWTHRTLSKLSLGYVKVGAQRHSIPQIGDTSSGLTSPYTYPQQPKPTCKVNTFQQPMSVEHQFANGRQGDIVYDAHLCSADLVKGFVGYMVNPKDHGSTQSMTDVVTIILGSDDKTGDDIAMTCPRHVTKAGNLPEDCYKAIRPATLQRQRVEHSVAPLSESTSGCLLSRIQPLAMQCSKLSMLDQVATEEP